MIAPLPLCEQLLFDLKEVAARTRVSARTWRRLIRAGRIGIIRIEGSVRIPEAELEQFLGARFLPAVKVREIDPETVKLLVDNAVSRRRGRPRIAGREPAA